MHFMCAQKEKSGKRDQLLNVLRSTVIYIEFACVCQLANCCANRRKDFDSEMDAIRWLCLTHYIDGVPVCGPVTVTVVIRYGAIMCIWRGTLNCGQNTFYSL